MKICLYTATALPKLGGQEAVVDALARQFRQAGHEPVVLAPRPRRPLKVADEQLPYPVRRHPRFISTRHFVAPYRRFLKAAHARFAFDVIHCHDVYPSGFLAGLCRPQLGVPLVITSHGGDVRDNNPRLLKPGIPGRLALALRRADALVSIGPFTEQGFKRIYPEATRIESIPNGIDLTPYQTNLPRPAGLDPGIRANGYALFLGRLARRKGVDVLLDALARVPASAGESSGVQLVVAGAGDERPPLEAKARQLNLQDRVRFVGRVDGSDKLYLLQNALFTVMPSRVWEAFPLVVLETFAAGRAVVGSAIPGIADLVEHEKTGLLFPEEDADTLAAAMARLFSNPQAARTLGGQAAAVAQNFTWQSVARRHLELYEELRSKNARASG